MKSTRILTILMYLILVGMIFSQSATALDSEGLVGYWHFDEGSGTTTYDTTDNHLDATLHGDVEWVEGIKGTALQFNGINSYLEIPNNASFNGFQTLTVSCWFNVQGTNIWEPLFNKGYTNEGITDIFEINIDSSGQLSFALNFENSGRLTYHTNTTTISTNTWHHFMGTYNGDTLTFYFDGSPAGTHDTPNDTIRSSNASLYLGIEYESPDETYYTGIIDEVAILSRTPTISEIEELSHSDPQQTQDTNPLITTTTQNAHIQENKAIERSLLSPVLPPPAIPLVATAVSILILILWNLFGNILVEFFSDYFSEHLLNKKETYTKKKEQLQTTKILSFYHADELLAILLSILVFSIAMSWTWTTDLTDFFSLFLLNITAIALIYILREGLRIHLGKQRKIHTRHLFWPLGAVLTLGSTLLGNTFSLASYTVNKEEENHQYAKMTYDISLLLFIVSLLFFGLQLLTHNILFQLICIFAIMTLFIDLTPLHPLEGKLLKDWNIKRWLLLYILVAISYIVIMFQFY